MPLKYLSNEIQYKLGEFTQRRNSLHNPQDQIHKKTLGREICSYITTITEMMKCAQNGLKTLLEL